MFCSLNSNLSSHVGNNLRRLVLMSKNIAILFLVSCLVFIGFQNCGDIKIKSVSNNSLSCVPQVLAIETDNTSNDNIRFLVRDIENSNSVSLQNFIWTVSENRTDLYTDEASEISIPKASLVACHTYQVQAVFQNCEDEETLSVNYTMDGPNCEPPTDIPPPPPPVYPPPNPAPPGQQTFGMGCSNGYGNNANFDYAHAKYCVADTSSTAELMACRNSGFDFTGSNAVYFPLIKPGKYLAVEVMAPHAFTNGLNKSFCGVYVQGEIGNSCAGSGGGAIETWTLSPNPGDFNVTDARCITHTTTSSLVGRVVTSPELGSCPMDPGRNYYLNIKMGSNCTAPGGCSFLLSITGLFSGGNYTISGQRYTMDNSCQLVRQ